MCSAATKAIDTAGNAALQSLPSINVFILLFKKINVCVCVYVVEIQIDDVSEVSYALVQAPSFTSSYLETAHKVSLTAKCILFVIVSCHHTYTLRTYINAWIAVK